jgi:hypothetical protein
LFDGGCSLFVLSIVSSLFAIQFSLVDIAYSSDSSDR